MHSKILLLVFLPMWCTGQRFDPFAGSNDQPGTGRQISSQRLGQSALGPAPNQGFQPISEPPNYGVSPPTYYSTRSQFGNNGFQAPRPFLSQPIRYQPFVPNSNYRPLYTPQVTGYVNSGGVSYKFPSPGLIPEFRNEGIQNQFSNSEIGGQNEPQFTYQRQTIRQQQGDLRRDFRSNYLNQLRGPDNVVSINMERGDQQNSGNSYDQSSEYGFFRNSNTQSQQGNNFIRPRDRNTPPLQIRQTFRELVDGV